MSGEITISLENLKKLRELLKGRKWKASDKHYGNSLKGKLKTIYIEGVFIHQSELNSLGFGAVSVENLEDVR